MSEGCSLSDSSHFHRILLFFFILLQPSTHVVRPCQSSDLSIVEETPDFSRSMEEVRVVDMVMVRRLLGEEDMEHRRRQQDMELEG